MVAAGYMDGRLATAGTDFIDMVFPRLPATFEVDFVSPAECPERVDRVVAYPLLDRDEIPR